MKSFLITAVVLFALVSLAIAYSQQIITCPYCHNTDATRQVSACFSSKPGVARRTTVRSTIMFRHAHGAGRRGG
jgi:hypothetical protein